ncbi:MAG TPA: LacI family DNA-binding transcriptional regulator [Microlunatus sp.]|nr:LacI family DNA-binding transcriptional regulator [Microlunatus sp.]
MSLPGTAPGPRPRATIRDVAALAGVGIKTVSRVINHESNVSEQMRERVERAITALNFQPHLGAGTLRRGDRKTLTLGLLLESVGNPFSAAINRAVEEVASSRGTAVFAASFDDDPVQERSLVRAFTRRRVDGLILTTISSDHGYLQIEREQGTPIVFVDRPPVGLLADAVVIDNAGTARRAVAHLVAHGHRRIVHFSGNPAISTTVERRRGFAEEMSAQGLDPRRYPVQQSGITHPEREVEAEIEQLMAWSEPPTAIFASQNLVTIAALRALHRLGLAQSVALIGLDDVPLGDLIDPPLTVLAQDPAAIGALAAQRLFARLDGDSSPEQTIMVPTELIVRGSGEIPPPPDAG